MTWRKRTRSLVWIAGTAGRGHHAVPLAGILPCLDHPLIALPVQRVVELHPGIAVLDAELYRGPGRIALERHGSDVHIHGRHIQPGLRLARAQVFDHRLPDGILILDVLSCAGRQQQVYDEQRQQCNSFHSTDYTCRPQFAVTLPYDGAL